MGLVILADPSKGTFARVAPRPRTGGFEGGTFRSFARSAGAFPVNTLLMARRGFVAFLGPRSAEAGPVGVPRFTGDDGIGAWGARFEPRGPLGAFGMFVCNGGPLEPLPSMFTSLLGCIPVDSDDAGPVGALGAEG
jgi:hypothetical protein